MPGNFYVVYKLKEGRSIFGFPGFMHVLVINPMEIKKDRIELKDLLRKRKLTIKELALLTGRPEGTVRDDIRSDPELKYNGNLLKRKYPAEKKIRDNLRSPSGIRQNI